MSAITGGKQVIQVAIVFLTKEREGDYNWALECFQELMFKESIEKPTVTITDRELALMASLDILFPSSRHILCRWHVNMNVLAKCKKHFPGPVKGPGKYFSF
jgi:MULE transposase domain